MIQTGDIVLLAPAKGKESFFQHGIQLMGSISTHNELVYIADDGQAYVGCAHNPYFELVPLEDRIRACEDGRSDMLIARWHEWPLHGEDWHDYKQWQARVAAQLLLLAELKVPYDKLAVFGMARNMVRAYLPFLDPIVKHLEYAVYCTENVEIITRIAGTFLFRAIAKQAFYAPVHIERILAAGQLNIIANWGLAERLGLPD